MLRKCMQEGRSSLNEMEAHGLLNDWGIPTAPGGLARDEMEARELARELGFPVVMKVLSPQIQHKAAAGGVRLDLRSEQDIAEAFVQITDSTRRAVPEATIQGVFVQRQVDSGLEIILGAMQDDHFGPVVTFGLGGQYVEILRDAVFRLAPVSEKECRAMVEDTLVRDVLSSWSDDYEKDCRFLQRIISGLSTRFCEHEMLQEVEVNPVVVWPGTGTGVAVDALVVLRSPGSGA